MVQPGAGGMARFRRAVAAGFDGPMRREGGTHAAAAQSGDQSGGDKRRPQEDYSHYTPRCLAPAC
jgi:hypothetical protein